MLKKSTQNVPQFIAGDKTLIRELLHPKNDGLNLDFSLAHATVEVGKASIPHILQKSTETYYILQGEGRVFIDDKEQDMQVGDLVFIPAGAKQYIENIGSIALIFLCIVSPPWKKADEIVSL